MGAEFLAHHPFPGIELAHHLDRHLVGVGEAPTVPADLRHGDRLAGEARLQRGVAQIFRRREILGMVLEAREVDQAFRRQLGQDAAPGLDQLLVDGIELVGVGLGVLQPVPLHDGRLVERGRRVGVVFQQLGRALAVEGEVEAAADRRIGAPPDLLDIIAPRRRDAHALPELVGDHMLDRLEAEAVQRLGRRLQRVDLVGCEGVTGLLGPVGLALQHVVVEAQLLELLLPARPRRRGFTAHQLAPDEPPDDPVAAEAAALAVARRGLAGVRRRRSAAAERRSAAPAAAGLIGLLPQLGAPGGQGVATGGR